MQTAAAQTVQAALATPLSSPAPGAGSQIAPGSAVLTVPDNTNCRSGPGTNYPIVTTLPAGSSVPIVAGYSGGEYWIVDPPNAENCWVNADLGSVAGGTGGLPEATIEPVSGEAPRRPGSFFYVYNCATDGIPGNLTTQLTWSDSADNESGYRVYRYGVLIIEMPANSTAFTDQTSVGVGDQVTYSIEAFNSAGASPQRSETFSCQ
jgi:hypothetical protein